MQVEVKMVVNVPISPYCGGCLRKEKDNKGDVFCTLYNRFIHMRRGNWLKCRECYNALYDAIEEGE